MLPGIHSVSRPQQTYDGSESCRCTALRQAASLDRIVLRNSSARRVPSNRRDSTNKTFQTIPDVLWVVVSGNGLCSQGDYGVEQAWCSAVAQGWKAGRVIIPNEGAFSKNLSKRGHLHFYSKKQWKKLKSNLNIKCMHMLCCPVQF